MSRYSERKREQRRQQRIWEEQTRFEQEQMAALKAGREINWEDNGPAHDEEEDTGERG